MRLTRNFPAWFKLGDMSWSVKRALYHSSTLQGWADCCKCSRGPDQILETLNQEHVLVSRSICRRRFLWIRIGSQVKDQWSSSILGCWAMVERPLYWSRNVFLEWIKQGSYVLILFKKVQMCSTGHVGQSEPCGLSSLAPSFDVIQFLFVCEADRILHKPVK